MAAASVVVDTITQITERMSSIAGLGDNKINATTENIQSHLSKIREVAEHSDGAGAAAPSLNWLFDVTDALNDLWDLLEDDQHLPKHKSSSGNITSSFLSLCNRSPPHRRRSLLVKLEQIEKQLQHVAADWTKALQQNNTEESITNSDRETEMVGKEDLKEQVISHVLALTEVKGSVSVVPIGGMRGMGKTTLARSICGDGRVKCTFDLVIWIDGIHDVLHAESVIERIIHESRMMKVDDEDITNLDLGEAFSGRRFLLVLDDFESENREEWIKLWQMLSDAARPSGAIVKILATTQNSFVATQVIGPSFLLGELNEEESWALFEKIAGEGRGGFSGSNIGDAQMKEMVKKCRGVPVAIVQMATRMLKSHKATTKPDTKDVEEELMREMKLIYYDELSSWHQKQCFAYLSMIFSSASDKVGSKTLIRLWMAEGFLGPVNSYSDSNSPLEQLQPEDLGLECILEFRRRSILKVHGDCGPGNLMEECSMYSELMLDLSRFVAGKDRFYFDMADDGDDNVMGTVRQVALTPDFDVSNWIPKFLNSDIKNLHTIMFLMPYNNGWPSRIPHEVKLKWSTCDAIFRAFNNLRVLNLTDSGMKMLPVSIGKLKSLRHLDLSHNNMDKLPNSIGKLKHLQTLILSHCHKLRELPNEVKYLVSLRHLEMEGCLHLTHLPYGLKKLANIQTLSHFMVSTSNSDNNNNRKHTLGLGELVSMNNLRGKLVISHLEQLKLKEPKHDGHAYLKEKQRLEFLSLQWNHEEDDNGDDNNHDQISLGHLEPHPDLQRLRIQGYRGTGFSQWLSSLKNLVRLTLYNCSKCEYLPPLDQFPELKLLQLGRLDSLEYITDQDDNCNEVRLGQLVHLFISDCPNLKSWWKVRTHHNNARFSSVLSRIEVRYCPKLECMPLFPDLNFMLVLESCSVKPLLDTINYTSASNNMMPSDSDSISHSFPPLYKLDALMIKNVEEQSPLPENWLKNFISLRYLRISGKIPLINCFKHLSSLKILIITNCAIVDLPGDEWKGLQRLQQLLIEEMTELESLPEGIKHLTSLTRLTIERCPDLTTLTEGICHLTSLTYLEIAESNKLASLPKGMADLKSLNKLIIRNCPLLLPRCQEETGDDWPQIKHIKDRSVTGTSEVYDE